MAVRIKTGPAAVEKKVPEMKDVGDYVVHKANMILKTDGTTYVDFPDVVHVEGHSDKFLCEDGEYKLLPTGVLPVVYTLDEIVINPNDITSGKYTYIAIIDEAVDLGLDGTQVGMIDLVNGNHTVVYVKPTTSSTLLYTYTLNPATGLLTRDIETFVTSSYKVFLVDLSDANSVTVQISQSDWDVFNSYLFIMTYDGKVETVLLNKPTEDKMGTYSFIEEDASSATIFNTVYTIDFTAMSVTFSNVVAKTFTYNGTSGSTTPTFTGTALGTHTHTVDPASVTSGSTTPGATGSTTPGATGAPSATTTVVTGVPTTASTTPGATGASGAISAASLSGTTLTLTLGTHTHTSAAHTHAQGTLTTTTVASNAHTHTSAAHTHTSAAHTHTVDVGSTTSSAVSAGTPAGTVSAHTHSGVVTVS